MAQSITNKAPFPSTVLGIPVCHTELADQAATTAVTNTGVAGLQFARARVRIKTLGTIVVGTDTITVTLQVGTGSGLTNPQNIASVSITTQTGDTEYCFDLDGWSQTGFQSWKVLFSVNNAHAIGLADIIFDAE